MPYVLLAIVVLAGLVLVVRGLRGTSPRNLARMAVLAAALVSAVAIVYLAASGRLGPAGWAAMLLPLLLRLGAVRRALRNLRGPTPGRSSGVETRYLRMELDHDSGVLRGTVTAGRHAGRTLDELSDGELGELLRECRLEDPQSAELLEAYIERVRGGAAAGAGAGAAGEGARAAPPPGGGMTRERAYEVLGLRPGASEDEIREAHRRLLRTNHPDRGGSTFIAAQINQAKDVLLSG